MQETRKDDDVQETHNELEAGHNEFVEEDCNPTKIINKVPAETEPNPETEPVSRIKSQDSRQDLQLKPIHC